MVSELITIQDGQYVVRTAVINDGQTLATGLAASVDIQIAEDKARERAITLLGLSMSSPAIATPEQAAQSTQLSPNPAIPSPPDKAIKLESEPNIETPDIKTPDIKTPGIATPSIETTVSQAVEPSLALTLESEEDLDPPEDLGPPIDVIEENAAPIDESLETEATPAKVSAATIALENFNASAEPVDLSDVIAQTDVELTRLGWTSTQGREYLEQTYRKRSRQQLTDEELMSFLLYLEDQ